MDYDTIFDEPYEVKKPDPTVLQEMDKLAEPVFREWLERQEQRERRKDHLFLEVNIAVGLIVLVLLAASLTIRILG